MQALLRQRRLAVSYQYSPAILMPFEHGVLTLGFVDYQPRSINGLLVFDGQCLVVKSALPIGSSIYFNNLAVFGLIFQGVHGCLKTANFDGLYWQATG